MDSSTMVDDAFDAPRALAVSGIVYRVPVGIATVATVARGAAVIGLVAGAGIASRGLGAFGARAPESACPAAFARDAERASRVAALVRSAAPGAGSALGERSDALAVEVERRACFGPAAGEGITPDGALAIDAAKDDRAAAARGAHLALHAIERAPGDAPRDAAECAAWLARARAAEERADDVERRVARALGAELAGRSVDARVADYARRCP